MIKVVIFDADGMLINQERPSIFLQRDYGIKAEDLNPFFDGPFQQCLISKADLKEIISPYLTLWGWTKGLQAFLDLWFTREVYINEEMVKYIKALKLKGIKCLLATNQEKYRFQYMLDQLNFSKIFTKAYSSADVGHKKPSQEFFSKILSDLKDIKKEEILFWDDRPTNVEGAINFGMNAEVFESMEDFEQKMKPYNL